MITRQRPIACRILRQRTTLHQLGGFLQAQRQTLAVFIQHRLPDHRPDIAGGDAAIQNLQRRLMVAGLVRRVSIQTGKLLIGNRRVIVVAQIIRPADAAANPNASQYKTRNPHCRLRMICPPDARQSQAIIRQP